MHDEELRNLWKFTQDEMPEDIVRMENREIDKIMKLQSLNRKKKQHGRRRYRWGYYMEGKVSDVYDRT